MEDLPQLEADKTMPVAWQHNKNLPDCMIELYDKSLWTDVRFHCKGQNEDNIIHAHKIVLAARSPVFQAMFFGPCADGKDVVVLENTDPEILDLVLRYIYNDRVTLSGENAASVLEMAHYYQVTILVQFCADYLSTIITTANACETLALVMQYELTTLGDACCSFIDKHAVEVLNSDGFLELPEGCLTYILKGDTFYANEDIIFKKAEEWASKRMEESKIENTGPNTRNTLGKSFNYLRLPTMTYQSFMECTRKKGFFSVEEYENIVDYINKIPDTYVGTNSCVARLPVNEKLSFNDGHGEKTVTDEIGTMFEVSVSRDVKLKYVVLDNIQAYFKCDGLYHKAPNSKARTQGLGFGNSPKIDIFSEYKNKAVKIESSRLFGGNKLHEMEEFTGKDLKELEVMIIGTLICEKTKSSDETVCENDDNEHLKPELEQEVEGEKKEGEIVVKENDDPKYEAILELDTELTSTETSQKIIVLKEPLFLTKTESPYRININLWYSCESEVKMKICTNNSNMVASSNGHIIVKNLCGGFAGISKLGFENISKR